MWWRRFNPIPCGWLAILDKKGKDISKTDHVTSLAPGRHGVKVQRFHRDRWGIENQGFRSLSQTWDIDRPAGHTYGAVLGRLVFVFMIYNARHWFEQQCRHRRPDYAEELRQMRRYRSGGRLSGSHDYRADGFRVLLCAVVRGVAPVAEAALGQDDAAGFAEGEITKGGDRGTRQLRRDGRRGTSLAGRNFRFVSTCRR